MGIRNNPDLLGDSIWEEGLIEIAKEVTVSTCPAKRKEIE